MNSWHSYPSIYNLGHRAILNLLTVEVNIEEKIDGSQFSFAVDESGELHVRSKGAKMHVDAPEKMFTRAVDTAKELAGVLNPGWTYRCEYLSKPKHNTLAYSRIPNRHLIVFDVNTAEATYLSYAEKEREANRIGLECVPLLHSGRVDDIGHFRSFLDRESILGGQKVEGVVVKPSDYSLFGPDKKALLGKFVSEAFKEAHSVEWKKSNPTSGDILLTLGNLYKTPARWQKSIIHLQERGLLQESPRDIGNLIKETTSDVEKECAEEIKQALWDWAWPSVRRLIVAGLPEWYKEELLKRQFEEPAGGNP